MALEADFRAMMIESIQVAPRTGVDAFGKPTYGSNTTYARCYVEQGARRVVNAQGQEVVSGARVYVDTTDQIPTTSRVTLPAGLVPSQPAILRVDALRDEHGPYATILVLA